MTNSPLKNNLGDLVTVCPYCKAHVVLQFQIIDLHIYTNFKNNLLGLTLKKSYSKTSENEIYIKSLLLNSLKKKPFIARVITNRPYFEIISELTKTGFLTNKDLKNINVY